MIGRLFHPHDLTAYHEAGHAVIGLNYGFPLDKIMTRPVQLENGLVGSASCRWLKRGAFVLEEFPIEQVTQMAAAGCYVEMAANKTTEFSDVEPEAYIFDIAQVRDQLAARGQDHTGEIAIEQFQRAVLDVDEVYGSDPRLVKAHDAIYLRILKALMDQSEYVSGAEVTDIFTRHMA